MGSKITISISKTKKITARRKNRVEKGSRADRVGSKPHSKGDSFSRSAEARVLVKIMIRNKSEGSKRARNMEDKEIYM